MYYELRGKPYALFGKWDEFLSKCDPEYKYRKTVYLCACHFVESQHHPPIDPFMVKMCERVKKEKQEKDSIKSMLKRAFGDDQVRHLLRGDSDSVKSNKTNVNWSPETMCKAVKMLEILGKLIGYCC